MRALQVTPGLETHLHGVKAGLRPRRHGAASLSPHLAEFACKKLLAAGERLIYVFARVYRSRERGPLQPEFTMLEWYRAEAPMRR